MLKKLFLVNDIKSRIFASWLIRVAGSIPFKEDDSSKHHLSPTSHNAAVSVYKQSLNLH